MMVQGKNCFARTWKFALVALLAAVAIISAKAQAPFLIPYTINTIAGGGTTMTQWAACAGGVSSLAADTLGDGCLATLVTGDTDLHDVGVDPQGNIYFIDNGSTGMIRRIDAHSGIVNTYAGSTLSGTPCSAAIDKYGDNCQANDGAGNVGATGNTKGGYTTSLAKARGLSVAQNGDVYFADYNGNLVHKISASTGIMTIVAGYLNGTSGSKNSAGTGYSGDGGPATSAQINSTRGVTVDVAGNVYIADTGNNVIRMLSASTGNISTIVGAYPGSNKAATAGSSGDLGPATSALLSAPEDVEIDANGNLFIGDFANNKVRVVYKAGTQVANLIAATNGGAVAQSGYIYTIAGNGSTTAQTYTAGSLVLATSFTLGNPRKLTVDALDNVYIADSTNAVVWFLDASTGYMRVIAGNFGTTSNAPGCGLSGTIGDGCHATQATLSPNSAMGIGHDLSGNLYISDSGDARVRKISVNQTFPAVAAGSSVTQILQVHFVAGDSPANSSPYNINGSADFTIASTNCTTNSDNTIDCLIGVAFAPSQPGNRSAVLSVASTKNGTATFPLSGSGTAGAVAIDPGTTSLIASALNAPAAIAVDLSGNTYVADTGDDVVVRYTNGTPTVLAGTAGTSGNSGNGGPATAALLSSPKAVTVAPDGAVYIADTGNNVVRRIDNVTGNISIVAGGASSVCGNAVDALGDGCLGTSATLAAPAGLTSDSKGNVYISDTGNNIVRELTHSGYIVAMTAAVFSGPTALAIDRSNNVLVADTGNNAIKKIPANNGTIEATGQSSKPYAPAGGIVSFVAGNGQSGLAGNDGPATGAELSAPTGVALDAAGNLYIADTGNHAIRMVSANGNISTPLGILGHAGAGTVPGTASSLQLSLPGAIATTSTGQLFVLDSGNNRAFAVDRTIVAANLGRVIPGTSSSVFTIQETSTGSATATLGQPAFNATGDSSDFTLTPQGTSGCTPGQALTPGQVCSLAAQFNPAALGSFSATYTPLFSPSISNAQSITLSAVGAVLTKTSSATIVTSPTSGNPTYDVAFTISTTVTPAACNNNAPSCVPTGTVQFYVGTSAVGLPVALNSTGVASTNINGQNVGSISVTAVYSGDDYYAGSTAPALSVTVARGATNGVVTFSAATLPQFQPITISAAISSPSGGIPTGTVNFMADGNLIGTATLNASGVASIVDPQLTDASGHAISPVPSPNSFGLYAGTHQITAVYSGDNNYVASTSPASTLTIQADTPAYQAVFISSSQSQVGSIAVGTAQGSTAVATVTITPTNTLNGNMTFACSGLPTDATCTVQPTSLSFTPVPGVPSVQTVAVTLWTNVAPGAVPTSTTTSQLARRHTFTSLAGFIGWPMLLVSFAGILGFRRRIKHSPWLMALLLVALLTGSSAVLSGCSSGVQATGSTPTGQYNVTLTISGPNNLTQKLPIVFNVGPGVAGED